MADKSKGTGDPKGQGKNKSHEDIGDEEQWGLWGPAGKGEGKDKGKGEGKGKAEGEHAG